MTRELRIELLPQKAASVNVNCYLAYDEVSGEAAVIDPGGQADNVLRLLEVRGVFPRYIILTHGHFDHIMCTAELHRMTGAPVCMNRADEAFITDPVLNAAACSGVGSIEPFTVNRYLADGDQVLLGESCLSVLETPGHTPGGISLYAPGCLICGDTILKGTTGRMDLPGADPELIRETILRKIFTLPDSTVILCGHNEATAVGYEKIHNDTANTRVSTKGTN